ncbi:MAG: DnaK suppressor protein [Micromonosporaceae bacterium]|jgi:RNA polymerase-binding transcription factor DksA|nr:DnaK suppressor protein [Micromonosporaceae bacterium]
MTESADAFNVDALVELLAAERIRAIEQIALLTADLNEIINASTSVATDDEHDPEGATIAFERAQVAAILDQARGRLADLDRAIVRLREGTYGRCEVCGQPIAPERLAARPAARTCIVCASRR